MAASEKNVKDLYEIITSHVPADKLDSLFSKLLLLHGNRSFDTTIELLALAHAIVVGDTSVEKSMRHILANKGVKVARQKRADGA